MKIRMNQVEIKEKVDYMSVNFASKPFRMLTSWEAMNLNIPVLLTCSKRAFKPLIPVAARTEEITIEEIKLEVEHEVEDDIDSDPKVPF